jgi:hypothetical protein
MPISINIIACLECSCHIWVLQLVYFDKIHHDTKKTFFFFLLFPFSHFSQMRNATDFVVLGHICITLNERMEKKKKQFQPCGPGLGLSGSSKVLCGALCGVLWCSKMVIPALCWQRCSVVLCVVSCGVLCGVLWSSKMVIPALCWQRCSVVLCGVLCGVLWCSKMVIPALCWQQIEEADYKIFCDKHDKLKLTSYIHNFGKNLQIA